MGVYDYIRGTCPHCESVFGYNEKGEEVNDFDTKDFNPISRPGKCFRTFTVGSKVPIKRSGMLDFIGPCPKCKESIRMKIENFTITKFY